MDSVFTKNANLDVSEISKAAKDLVEIARDTSLTGSVCWHDVAFRKNSIMEKSYAACLEIFNRANIALISPQQFIEFKKQSSEFRENIVNGKISLETSIPLQRFGARYISAKSS